MEDNLINGKDLNELKRLLESKINEIQNLNEEERVGREEELNVLEEDNKRLDELLTERKKYRDEIANNRKNGIKPSRKDNPSYKLYPINKELEEMFDKYDVEISKDVPEGEKAPETKEPENEIEQTIADLEKQLQETAKRMKEYGDNGFENQEAAEHQEYNKILARINELKEITEQTQENSTQQQIQDLEKLLKQSAERMAEYKRGGFENQEIAEHQEYNRILTKINELKGKEEQAQENSIQQQIQDLEKLLKQSAERMAEYRRNGFYDQASGEHQEYNRILTKINELKNREKENEQNDKEIEENAQNGEIKWHPRLTPEQIEELIAEGIEPGDQEYNRYLWDHGINPFEKGKENEKTDKVESKWHPRLTPEQIEELIAEGIEPGDQEYNRYLWDHGINPFEKDKEKEPKGRDDDSEGPEGPGGGTDGPGGGKEDPEDDGGKIIGGPDDHRVGPGGGRGDDPDLHPTIQTGLQIFRREFNEMPEILKKHTFSENPLLPLPGSVALALATAGIVTGPIGWAGAAGVAALSYFGAKPLLRKITGQSKLEKQITEQFNDMDPKELKAMADYLTEERIIDLKPNAVILRALNRSLRTIAQRENADLEREMNEAEQERDELLAREEPLTESEKERLETLKKEIDDKVKEMEDNERRAKEARRGKERISAAYKGNIRGSKILNIFHKRNSTTQEYKDALNEYADKEKEMLEAEKKGDAISAAKAQKEMKETGEKNTYTNGLRILRSPFNMRSAPARVVSDREDHTVRNVGMFAMAWASITRTLRGLYKANEAVEQVVDQYNKDANTVNNFANQFNNQQNSFTNASTSITDSNITRAARAHAKGIADAGEINSMRLNGNASLDPSYVQSDKVINSRIDTMSQNIGKFPSNSSVSDKLRWLADYLKSGESTATLKESQNLAGNIHSGAGVDHLSQIDLQQTAIRDNKNVAKLYDKFADLYDQGQGFLKMKAPTLKTMTQDFKADLIGPFAQFFTTLSAPVIDIFKGRDKYKVKPEEDREEVDDDKKKDNSEER